MLPQARPPVSAIWAECVQAGDLGRLKRADLGPFNVAACVAYCGSLTKPAAIIWSNRRTKPQLRFWVGSARGVLRCASGLPISDARGRRAAVTALAQIAIDKLKKEKRL